MTSTVFLLAPFSGQRGGIPRLAHCGSVATSSTVQAQNSHPPDATGTAVFSAGSRNARLGGGQEDIPSVESASVKQVARACVHPVHTVC